jgi:membrane peptidoglycan carboxypeptidase
MKIVGSIIACIVLALAVQFCIAYVETPAIVVRAQQSNDVSLQVTAIPANRLQWYLEVEDPNFYNHHGVDWTSPGAGYTTITQGIVKRLFYSKPFTPGLLHWRKLQQIVIAIAFDARVPKDEQLRLALNLSYMGKHNGRAVFGFSQASQEFFGKEVSALSDDEFLSLVATLVAPARFSPVTHAAENKERVDRIRRLIEGRCKPLNVADVEYVGCQQK